MTSPVALLVTAIVFPPAPLALACGCCSTVDISSLPRRSRWSGLAPDAPGESTEGRRPAAALVSSGRGRRAPLDALDDAVLERAVAGARGRGFDAVDRLHPRGHASEHGVLAVEPGRRVGCKDEELAPVRVRPRIGHGERPAEELVLGDLVLEGVAGPARTGAERVAALDHEAADHAVEDQAIVEAVGRE